MSYSRTPFLCHSDSAIQRTGFSGRKGSVGLQKASYIRGHVDISPRLLASHSKHVFFFFRYACIHVYVDVYCVYVIVYMSLYASICLWGCVCVMTQLWSEGEGTGIVLLSVRQGH